MTFPLLALGAFLELEILALKSFSENSLADAEEEKASEVAVEALGESYFNTLYFVSCIRFWIYCLIDQSNSLLYRKHPDGGCVCPRKSICNSL